MVSVIWMLSWSVGQAATLAVPADGDPTTIDYDDLQAAFDAAVDGDTIFIGPGNYYPEPNPALGNERTYFVDADVTIQGSGAAITSLMSNVQSTRVLQIGSLSVERHVVLKDISFIGTDDFSPLAQSGVDMRVAQGSTLSVENAYFYQLLSADFGGALFLQNVDLTVQGSSFDANIADDDGGAIYALNGTTEIRESEFFVNWSNDLGGALFLYNQSDIGIFDSGFDRNGRSLTFTAITNRGGGLYGFAENVRIEGNTFCANTADFSGGGIQLESAQTAEIVNNVFGENAGDVGGGIFMNGDEDDNVNVWFNTFAGNKSVDNGGGPAALFDGFVPSFQHNLLTRNSSPSASQITSVGFDLGSDIDIEYNLFFPGASTVQFGGDLASYGPAGTNVYGDPLLTFWGNDGSCYTDAFYTEALSPAINSGDPLVQDVGGSIADIGAYGGPEARVVDKDGDGWENVYDCNENNILQYPTALEVCDSLDNDCDGLVDEEDQVDWWKDSDGDGFGDESDYKVSCVPLPGYVTNHDDCNDNSSVIGAEAKWFQDQDEDGLGDPSFSTIACVSPVGWVVNDDDCDDADETILDFIQYYEDADADGYGNPGKPFSGCTPPEESEELWVLNNIDCNDTDDGINIDADELCDGIDNNCNIDVDENPIDLPTWYPDVDKDGFGDPEGVTIDSCGSPGDYSLDKTDCDDNDVTSYPGAPENCDQIDHNCDGDPYLGSAEKPSWYLDLDEDGFGTGTAQLSCTPPETGQNYASQAGDCDDANAERFPGAAEVCDAIDNDCNNTADDNATDMSAWYEDRDGDGVGAGIATESCAKPAGQYSSFNTDCDDTDPELDDECAEGCKGCDAGGSGAAPWLGLVAMAFGLRRRRAR